VAEKPRRGAAGFSFSAFHFAKPALSEPLAEIAIQ
jgi:hypothetical protein